MIGLFAVSHSLCGFFHLHKVRNLSYIEKPWTSQNDLPDSWLLCAGCDSSDADELVASPAPPPRARKPFARFFRALLPMTKLPEVQRHHQHHPTNTAATNMSKQQLQEAAYESSGVSYEESLLAQNLQPSLYQRIGQEPGFQALSQDFYDRVFRDKDAAWFLNIFSSSTKQEAVDNQVSNVDDWLVCKSSPNRHLCSCLVFGSVQGECVATLSHSCCCSLISCAVSILCTNIWWSRSLQVGSERSELIALFRTS